MRNKFAASLICTSVLLMVIQSASAEENNQTESKPQAVVKTFKQAIKPALVTEEKIVPQSETEKEAVEIRAAERSQMSFTVSSNIDGEMSQQKLFTYLRNPVTVSSFSNLQQPTCKIEDFVFDTTISWAARKNGTTILIIPSHLTEDGVIALVSVTIDKGKNMSMQPLMPECTVFEGSQKSETTSRVVSLSWGLKATITTDSDDEIQITANQDNLTMVGEKAKEISQ